MQESLKNPTDEDYIRLYYDWRNVWARPKQIPPAVAWVIWFILAGRGWGKTRTGAEWIRERVENEGARRIALVAPTAADARDVMVEGQSGILNISPPWDMPVYEPSKRRVTWPNGAVATLYSAEEPNRLNGPQHDTAWSDEVGIWKYGRETWDMLQFGLRLGDAKQIVTTTPKVKNISLIKEILAKEGTVQSSGSTYENRDNLSKVFFNTVIKKYEGTRLGRQELKAELLEDVPGALWKRRLIEDNREPKPPEMQRIVVGVDPQGKKDTRKEVQLEDKPKMTGIVICGLGVDGLGYVLEDKSVNMTPKGWGSTVISGYDKWEADRVIGEINYGGQMVEYVVKSIDNTVSYKEVHASRGKIIRAEPISSLYEQNRIKHVGTFPELEDEMCSYTAEVDWSPNRLDAMVWAFTELMLKDTGSYKESTSIGAERDSGHII